MGEAAEPVARSRGSWLVWPFAALGVVTAIAIIWLVVATAGSFSSDDRAIVAPDHAGGETLEVGNVAPLIGTNLIAIEIDAVDDGASGKGLWGSSYADDTRNLLLLDRKTGASRRILPNNSTRIAAIDYLPAAAEARSQSADEIDRSAGSNGKGPPPAYYLLMIERRLKNDDKVYDLLVGTLATGKQAIVMSGLSGMDQNGMIDPTRLGVVVREGKALYYRVIDIPALKQVESNKIEIG